MVGYTYTRNMRGSSNLNIIRRIKCGTMINEKALFRAIQPHRSKDVRETESNLMLLLSNAFDRSVRRAMLHARHPQSRLPLLRRIFVT
jgi:hypothetical protein